MLERGHLTDHPPQGHADKVRGREAVAVKDPHGVFNQAVVGEGPSARVVGRRPSRFALIEANDVTTMTG